MQISSVNNISSAPAGGSEQFAKTAQAFRELGSALDSGSLSDAKNALAQLQKVAPAQSNRRSNPISEKVETLSKALDSGDLKTAKSAYADIQKTVAATGGSRPSRGAGGGKPPGGGAPAGGAKGASAASSSSATKTYDKKDANKDGTVSAKEEAAYDLAHPEDAVTSSVVKQSKSGRVSLDTVA